MSVRHTTEALADKVKRSVTRWLGAAAAAALLGGCTAFGTTANSSQGAVAAILKKSGQPVFTRVVLTPDPERIQVAVRADATETWWTSQGAGNRVEQPSVTGASRPDEVDFDALDAQLDALSGTCSDEPRLDVIIGASGAVVADSVCAGRITATSVDGREPTPVQLDLASVEGIDQVLKEAAALVPNQRIFQISLPGPASPRGDSARAEGGTWTLADGTTCVVSYLRAGQGNPSDPLRSFRCDGFGQQKTDFETQQPIDPATLDAAQILQAIGRGLDESGFDPQTVVFYGVYDLYLGPVVAIVTTDGGYFEVDV